MIQRLVTVLLLAGVAVAAPVEARAQSYFGRNKVQSRSITMKVIPTDHFDIHFDEDARLAAMNAAQMAERAYARLSRILKHEFRERKPIIIYASHGDFQQTNAIPDFIDEGTGAFAEPTKNRIVIPFTGSYAEFEHVLTHELVHAFQFDIIYRRTVISDAAPTAAPPLWFMEGMAEYLSLGRIDSHTAAWVRDAVLSGYLRTIGEMSQNNDYLSYRFGQSLWAYIGERWGDEAIGVILQQTPRIGVGRAMQRTLGISIEELSQEWSTAVRSEYLLQVTDHDRPDRVSSRLTNHTAIPDPWYLAPAISPDGNRMVFLSQRDGFSFDMFLADARTGKIEKKLADAAGDANLESLRFLTSSAAFSPDGRYLAFVAQSGGRDALFIYDLQRNQRAYKLQFRELNGIANPTWAPDGQRLAFSGMKGGISDLYVTDLIGRLEQLTDDRHAALLPAWSPDGRTIAFTTDHDTDFDRLRYGNYRVALYHLDTRQIEVLPHQEDGKNVNPVWAPDGRSLVWVSDRTGINNLYLYDLDEAQLYRITDLLSGVSGITPLSPALSWAQQDGRLLFVYFEQAGYNIYAVEDPRRLPRVPVTAEPPALVAQADQTPGRAGGPTAPSNGGPGPRALTPQELGPATSYYRDGDTFRPSAMLPNSRSADRAGPISVAALLDSVDLALPDTTDFEVRDYGVRFTPDVIGRPTIGAEVGGSYGNAIYGGSYISLSDMLGNHNLVFAGEVNGSFSDAIFFAGYASLGRRANWGISLSQEPYYRYLGTAYIPDPNNPARDHFAETFVRDVMRAIQGTVAYPFNTYRRAEVGAAAVFLKQDLIYDGYYLYTGEPLRRDERIGSLSFYQPSAALVFDNSVPGYTGPIFGRRYRIQFSHALGGFSFAEGLVDFRNYMNFGRRFVLASRFVALARQGRDADRFRLYWGGPYYLRGYDGESFALDGAECMDSRGLGSQPSISQCPVRDQLIGSSGALMNLELRVPIVDELQIGFLGNFPPLDLVGFFDGGIAWQSEVCAEQSPFDPSRCAPGRSHKVKLRWDRRDEDPYLVREPLFSYGVGLRLNVFYTILRLDYAVPLNRPDRSGRFSFSLGPSF